MPIKKQGDLHQIIKEQQREIEQLKNQLDAEKTLFNIKLKDMQLYYEELIALLPGHVYWLDTNNVFLGCNNQQAIDAGLSSRHEIVGKTNYDMPWFAQADELNRINNLAMHTGLPQIHEEFAQTVGGEGFTYLSHKVPFRDKFNNIEGVLGISLDISKIKELELSLREAKVLAETANEAKDVFIQNMSHDIRTPLTGIIGMSSILEQEVQKQEEKEHAHMVNISGEQLLSLLNSVLDIVKGGQEHHINLKSFSVAQLLKDLRDLELPTAQLKHLELNIDIAASTPEFIISDYTKMHRIILNLLGNALKFTVQGNITLSAQASVPVDNKCVLELLIKDTGLGIPNEFKDKVFDRFFKITPSHKGLYQGYGVGLHIVQQYLEQLNGAISFESELGIGTVFKITIPVQIDASKKQHMNTPDNSLPNKVSTLHSSDTHSSFILLIEDNLIALKMAEAMTTNANCRYLSATSGEEAFELYKAHDFDLVLSDIGLPGMSGNQLAQAIRAYEQEHQKTPKPIIGLTAHAVDEAEAQSLASGMNKVLTKPIRLEVLKEIITEFIATVPVQHIDRPNHSGNPLISNEESELFQLEQFALFDPEQALKSCGGNKAMLIELLTLMITKELPADLEQMKRAYDAKNYPLVEKIAHKIKGGAVYLGTTRMKYACLYVERYWKSGQRELFPRLYNQAVSTIEDSCSYINNWFNNQGNI